MYMHTVISEMKLFCEIGYIYINDIINNKYLRIVYNRNVYNNLKIPDMIATTRSKLENIK